MEEMYQLLDKIGDFAFATVDEQGKPRIRTIMLMFVEDGKLFFTTSRKKDVYKQLVANPNIAINGKSKGVSLSVYGAINFSDDPKHLEKMYEAYPPLHELYKDNPQDLCAFYMEHGEARIFDLSVMPPRTVNHSF